MPQKVSSYPRRLLMQVREGGRAAAFLQLRLHPAPGRLVAELQNQFVVNPLRSLHVDLRAFPAEKNVDAAIAIADTRLADIADAGFDAGLLAAPGFVVAGRGVHFQHPANPADRHAPTAANRVHQLAFTSRPHSFRRMASCSIFLSSERSATSLRSRILVLELLQPAHVRRQHPSYF